MKILNGKELSAKLKDELKAHIDEHKQTPIMAVITIGNDEASKVYVKNKKLACEYVGISFLHFAYEANVDEYNMLEVIMVYIGDDGKTDNKLLKMLDKIFSKAYNVGEKISCLQDECGINTTSDINKEVEGMCNYSEYVRDKGRAEGMDIVNKLTALLLEAKRFDDLKRSTEDRDFQNQLLQEFGLA